MPPGQVIAYVILAVFFIVNLLILVLFLRIFRLWLQAFLSGARLSIPSIVLMYLRRSPVDEIVRLRIMSVQAGVAIPTNKIESAALIGVNIERAVLALIRARELGMDVSWEEVISQDINDRLRDQLFPDGQHTEN